MFIPYLKNRFRFLIQQYILNNKINENGMDKNEGTLNLIFCCTTFGGNHCKQAISVALNVMSAPVNR